MVRERLGRPLSSALLTLAPVTPCGPTLTVSGIAVLRDQFPVWRRSAQNKPHRHSKGRSQAGVLRKVVRLFVLAPPRFGHNGRGSPSCIRAQENHEIDGSWDAWKSRIRFASQSSMVVK